MEIEVGISSQNSPVNYHLYGIDAELAQYGISLLRLVLECLWVWAKWFPVDPETNKISLYKLTLEKLIKIGTQFFI